MSTAYESIMQGLNEALDHAQGKEVGARVHAIEVPVVDVAAIRAQTEAWLRKQACVPGPISPPMRSAYWLAKSSA